MSLHTDKNKRQNWKLKFELFKARSQIFCLLYAPVIISALELLVESYRVYSSKDKGGKP
jgi:hypothetical protein